MKNIKFYVLYDEQDFPILYFNTLKEFCESFSYSYKNMKNQFCKTNSIDLMIDKKSFRLYKFVD